MNNLEERRTVRRETRRRVVAGVPRLVAVAAAAVLAATLLAGGCSSMGGARRKADEAVLAGMSDTYVANMESGDVERYMSLWAEDGIQMPPDAPQVYGKSNIRKVVTVVFDNFDTSMSINNEEVVVAGDWGYMRGTYILDLTPKAGGDPMHVDGKFLTVYRRQPDGTWLIVRDCFNSNVPPPM
jgi:uncharacterized protein (TIGR02246 family)